MGAAAFDEAGARRLCPSRVGDRQGETEKERRCRGRSRRPAARRRHAVRPSPPLRPGSHSFEQQQPCSSTRPASPPPGAAARLVCPSGLTLQLQNVVRPSCPARRRRRPRPGVRQQDHAAARGGEHHRPGLRHVQEGQGLQRHGVRRARGRREHGAVRREQGRGGGQARGGAPAGPHPARRLCAVHRHRLRGEQGAGRQAAAQGDVRPRHVRRLLRVRRGRAEDQRGRTADRQDRVRSHRR